MRSFDRKIDNRRQVFLALASSIEGQLRDAYAKKYEAKEETQASLARKLGVGRSVVNRRLRGHTNMTIESLADMAWALGHCIEVEISDPKVELANRKRVVPSHGPTQFKVQIRSNDTYLTTDQVVSNLETTSTNRTSTKFELAD